MRVLLTGASGYVGLHVLREMLERGHAVTAIVRSPGKLGPFAQAEGIIVVEADLDETARVARALEGQEACVHAALLWGAPGEELEMRDAAASARLFDAAGRAGVSRCVYVSSVAVHRPFTAEMSEEDGLGATDLYGATKAAGELVLRAACAQHGMSGVVVRAGPIVGPPAFPGASFRTDRRLEAMVAAAVEGRQIEVTEGEGRQLSDVAVVAKAARLLATEGAPHPRTCASTGRCSPGRTSRGPWWPRFDRGARCASSERRPRGRRRGFAPSASRPSSAGCQARGARSPRTCATSPGPSCGPSAALGGRRPTARRELRPSRGTAGCWR